MSLAISIGIDIGQRHEASAIAVVETQWRQVGRQHTAHFITRTLTRLSAGTPYTAIAARLGEVLTGVQQRMAKEAPPREQTSLLPDGTRVHTVASWQALPVYADATGIGQPVLDLLAAPGVRIIPTYFNHGDRRLVDEQGIITLGKGWLVTRLKVLLQTGQLLLPPHQGRWWDALGHPHGQWGAQRDGRQFVLRAHCRQIGRHDPPGAGCQCALHRDRGEEFGGVSHRAIPTQHDHPYL